MPLLVAVTCKLNVNYCSNVSSTIKGRAAHPVKETFHQIQAHTRSNLGEHSAAIPCLHLLLQKN